MRTDCRRAPGPRERAKAATREKVMAAARALFAGQGYETVGVRDIARVAGMSTGAVFTSFAGKAELYAAIYGHPPVTAELGRELMQLGVGFLKVGMSCSTRAKLLSAVRRCGYVEPAEAGQ